MAFQKTFLTALACLMFAGTAQAATFVVDRTDDTAAATACTAAANDCSLRGAVIAANAAAGADTITLPAGIYTLSVTGTCENAAATGDLDIINGSVGSDITINGSTTGSSIIDGNGTDRVFHIPAITVSSALTLNNVTVRNGDAVGCTMGDAHGGGIRLDQGRATFNNTTFSGNRADDDGGGIYANGFGATVVAINSTISGNSSGVDGGGVASRSGSQFRNVTITDNTAGDDGGGLFLIEDAGSIDVRNTIIAGNNDTAGGNSPDCGARFGGGSITSQGFNLIGNDNDCANYVPGTGDQIGTVAGPINPQLGPLADNGGPTQTHLPLAGSRAIDLANPAGCFSNDANNGAPLASDQRSLARPLDGDVDGDVRCDVGAVEVGCGNGQVELNESCDDGNSVDGDGCDSQCVLESCGDGVVQSPEGCDDGNNADGDGCNGNCVLESCGNGTVDTGEDCDDGNLVNTDACLNTCVAPVCGDGFVRTGTEQCDDGNTKDGDKCSSTCTTTFVLLGDGGCGLIPSAPLRGHDAGIICASALIGLMGVLFAFKRVRTTNRG